MGFRASPRVRRSCAIAVPLGLVAVLAVTLVSCVGDKSDASAQSVVTGFVDALNDRDAEAAAELTSYPNAAEESIQQMFDGLDAKESTWTLAQFMELNGDSGFFTVDAAWNFGEGKDWSYFVDGGVRSWPWGGAHLVGSHAARAGPRPRPNRALRPHRRRAAEGARRRR